MKRSEIASKYKWDLTDIFKNREEFLSCAKKIPDMLLKIKDFKGNILKSAETLKEFLDFTHDLEKKLEKMEVYNYCIHDVELDNIEAIEGLDLTENLISEYNSSISFVIPEILSADKDYVLHLISEVPELSILDKYFREIFRQKKYILSEDEERILASLDTLSEGYSKTQSYLTDKEIDYGEITVDGKRVKLFASNIPRYSKDKNRQIRKAVYERESESLKQFNETLSNNYISFVKNTEIVAKLRHFDNYLEKVFYENDIDIKVYDTLKSSVKKYNGAYQMYVDIFKRKLRLKEIYAYDMKAPLFDNSKKEYTVAEAKEIILDTFKVFGSDYTNMLNYAFDNGLIDYYPCENKSTGWSSIYSVATLPRVFANFEGKILDISSLSHELGHFCNQYLSVKNNPFEYVYHSTFCAEVASLTNEILFSNLYKTDDKDVKSELLFNFVKIFAGNFFGASRQAVFEESIHMKVAKGEALSSEVLNTEWLKCTKEIFGDEVKGYSPYAWSSIPHFFLGHGYYVYNYATAIVAATNVASKILKKEEGFLDKYMEYLKMGSNLRPQECLKILDIDMTDSKTNDIAIKLFKDAINDMLKLEEER